MKAARFLARMLVAALLGLALAGCRGKLPRPGKPTARQEQAQHVHRAPREGSARRPDGPEGK